jgi:YidC/Oxa1 family membrane protein insertase
MRKNAFNVIFFLVVATGLTFLFLYADKHWVKRAEKPAPPPPQATAEEKRQLLHAVAGSAALGAEEAREVGATLARLRAEERARDEKKAAAGAVASTAATAVAPRPIPREPGKPVRLIALGGDRYYNRVLLTTRGGGVQQVVLPLFDAADRLGREVKEKDENGNPTKAPVPFFLIPGQPQPRGRYLREDYVRPTLEPGEVKDPTVLASLSEPSFLVFHYRNPDDKFPDPELGTENWDVVEEQHPEGGVHKVVFERQLGAPYFVKFRKTYTLGPRDYHVGLRVDVEALPGREKGKGQLRIQISGPRGLPIEGEWYTTMYRAAIIGWQDRKGTPRRQYEDAATVAVRRGGEAVTKVDNVFKYMVVATQYFASGVAVDNTAGEVGAVQNPWAYVRATTELPFDKKSDPAMPYFDDVTVRAASDVIDLAAPGQTGNAVAHSYLLYNGPSKVRLLGLMEGDRAVDDALVTRYQEDLGLRTITDFRSDTWLGRFANLIYWTDLVIAFTNLMHWLLASIHSVLPHWALSIVILTVIVRLLLFYPSKKQTQMNMKMMEVQKRLAPQIEELKKKYPDNPHEFNRAKMQLLMANGVNPFAAMGGCLLLLFQMPVMMGLYFCLQESVFFRLEPFLWVNNLAAPDMLFWWSEKIPFVSTPEDLGSFLYLGPYFNALPLLAVALMIWQQNKMMPPPTDEQMAQQQRMMKIMMILVAVMFYKVAAGLALYFIIGTSWGLIERRFIPKADDKKSEEGGAGETAGLNPKTGSPNGHPTSVGPVELPKAKGLLGRLREAVQKRMEEMQRQADEQSRRQIRKDRGGAGDGQDQTRRDQERRDRKKRRRK